MNFVVAGAVFLLSLLVGAASYAAIPRFTYESGESDDEGGVRQDAAPAASIADFFRTGAREEKLFLFLLSLVCAAAAYLLHAAGSNLIDLGRQIAVSLALLSAMIIDRKTHRIPNALVLLLLGAGVVLLALDFIFFRESFVLVLIQCAAGFLCCVVLFYLLARLTKDGVGMGDVKMIAAMGWLLGLTATIFSVLLSLILCSLAAIFLLFGKKKNKNDRIPFGPFLFFGHICLLFLFSI